MHTVPRGSLEVYQAMWSVKRKKARGLSLLAEEELGMRLGRGSLGSPRLFLAVSGGDFCRRQAGGWLKA